MSEQWFDVGAAPHLTITCDGSIALRGRTDGSVVAKGSSYSIDGTHITSEGNLKLLVPKDASVTFERVEGSVKLKALGGSLSAESISGDVSLFGVQGAINITDVHGDLRINDSSSVTIENVHGDLKVRGCGELQIQAIHGDATVAHSDAGVSLHQVYGDVMLRTIGGDVNLPEVHGDVAMGNVAGIVNVIAHDDIRLNGALGPGKHHLKSESTLAFRWPPEAPLTLTALAPNISNKLPLVDIAHNSKAGELSGRIGDGACTVTLEAAERITLRPDVRSEYESDWESFAEFDFDMSGIGERISAELNAKMAEFSTSVGPEINMQVERALRKAQSAIDRAVGKMDSELKNSQRRGRRPTPPPPPRKPGRPRSAPTPPPAPETPVDTTAEQLKILKMLEEGTISVNEANELLAALS